MATTVTGKLNAAATQFAAGESTGFGLRIGVQYYDRETKQKEWTNYECAIFAKAPAQVQFYQQALVEGAVVELTGQQIKIKQFEGQNGLRLSLELIDAKLGYAFNPSGQQAYGQNAQQQQQQRPAQQQQGHSQQQPQQMPAPQQQQYQQQPNQQPQQQYQEDHIPF